MDVVTGNVVMSLTSLSIGPGGPGSLAYNLVTANQAQAITQGFVTNNPGSADYSVNVGPSTETFQLSGALGSGTFSQRQGRGSTLTYDGSTQRFTYTSADGTVGLFAIYTAQTGDAPVSARLLTLTYPAGEKLTFAYRTDVSSWVQSISSNLGYQLRFVYGGSPLRTMEVVLFNMADETCDPNAASCTLTGTWPRLTWDGTGGWTDVSNRTARIQTTSTQKILTFPGGRQVTYNLDTSGRVTSVSDGNGTWTYAYNLAQGVSNTLITAPATATQRRVYWNTTTGEITAVQTGTSSSGTRTTAYPRDSFGRVDRIAYPNGVVERFTYDSRGNITERRRVSATPGTPADIVTAAGYPSTCSNLRTCNQPVWTRDALQNQTDYAYDGAHGGLTSITLPAGSNGVRPQTRFGYTPLSATYRNGSGTMIQGTPVYRRTSVSQCQTLASCTNASDEARTTISYGTNEALLPVSTTARSGDNALTATATFTYTPAGDLETVDGPLTGTADTVRHYYDAARHRTGTIGPDPDGGGTLLRRAIRTTYAAEGRVTSQERGTATSQGATSMSSFQPLERQVTEYNAQGRVSRQTLAAGTTTYALRQYSYTAAGLVDCAALRMNPAQFGSTVGACTLHPTGSYGPDRITSYGYNAFLEPTRVTTGVGTGIAADEVRTTYNNAGLPATIADGRGNLTTLEYDGFSRLVRTRYPDGANGTVSSTTDDEILGLDANGNVLSRTLRDGTVIGCTYDALNRVRTQDPPGTELTVTYNYDNLSRMTSVSTTSQTLTFGYDALGRNTSQGGPLGTTTYQYDAAGRRTALDYPGTVLVINYDYLVTGEVSAIRENGATSGAGVLATFGYDNLGRRTSVTRGNGTVTAYGYDAVSRLSQLVQSLPATTNNLTLSFTYNPASQIATNTRSNELYSYTDHVNQNVTDTHNGLNQVTATGGTAVTHDARGNISAIGSAAYTYNSRNMLTSGGGGTLSYDPLLRLYEAAGRRWAYDGAEMIAEYNTSNTLLRRFVHGPGVDEPIVWYEGTGLTDRRFLHADERGSIVAITDGTGAVIGTNRYDAYGVPENPVMGRFQYTGQVYFSSLGLYYYRARFYNPTLGRFMQSDPIGYGGGMNLYAYVRNDPVNNVDPLGLCDQANASRGSATGECIWVWGTRMASFQYADPHYSSSSFGSLPSLPPLFGGMFQPAAWDGDGEVPPTRTLTQREKNLFTCQGVDPAHLEEITLHNSMNSVIATAARLNPFVNAGAITQYSDIYYRSGYPAPNAIFNNLSEMRILAEEIGHSLQYQQGMGYISYAKEWWRSGYRNSFYERIARDFADHVVDGFTSGRCTGSYALPAD